MPSSPALLITDMDNTLYDFPTYYEAGLKAMVSRLCEVLDIEEETVIERLRAIYATHQSIEYPFAIEEIPELHALGYAARQSIIKQVISEFWTEASKALCLYPTVMETLHELRRQRIPVVAYTDAPIHEAVRRLRKLKIDKYVTGLVAQQWFRRRPKKSFAIALTDVPGFGAPPRKFRIVWRIPSSERKPSASVYSRIRSEFDIESHRVAVVGDSITRDLSPAIDNGMRAIWARYGKRSGGAATEQLLMRVVPSRHPEVGHAIRDDSTLAVTIDSFHQVIETMPVQQVIWFTAGDFGGEDVNWNP